MLNYSESCMTLISNAAINVSRRRKDGPFACNAFYNSQKPVANARHATPRRVRARLCVPRSATLVRARPAHEKSREKDVRPIGARAYTSPRAL